MPATTRATRAMHDRIIHPECESDRHDGTGSCVCPTRRQKERDARGDGWIPKEDPQHEARFSAMPEPIEVSKLGLRIQGDPQMACAHHDPELWFPIGTNGPAQAQAMKAKRICLTECPLVDDCATEVLGRNEEFGVWGGMTPEERRRIRAQMRGGRVA